MAAACQVRVRWLLLATFSAALVSAEATSLSVQLNDGSYMPRIAAGTWQYTQAEAHDATTQALNAGFRHIDTAHDYCADSSTGDCSEVGGSVQQGIGAAIQESGIKRESLYLTTKVPGCGLQGIRFNECAADSVAAAKSNLEQLRMNYTDLLLVHFPPRGGCGPLNCAAMRKQWSALTTEILGQNLTRSLGVSNFCVSCLKCLMEAPNTLTPAVNQIEYHIGMGADPEGLLSFSASKGIITEAYSPLGTNTSELIHGELTTTIGKAHNRSSAEVALRWILQHIPSVTTKSAKASHLVEDLNVLGWSLSQSEMDQLDALTKPAGSPSFMCTS